MESTDPRERPRHVYEDLTFEGVELIMDFVDFRRCIFDNCLLTYLGFGNFTLDDCTTRNCNFKLAGSAAKTLDTLRLFYSFDGPLRQSVETLFNEVRKGVEGIEPMRPLDDDGKAPDDEEE